MYFLILLASFSSYWDLFELLWCFIVLFSNIHILALTSWGPTSNNRLPSNAMTKISRWQLRTSHTANSTHGIANEWSTQRGRTIDIDLKRCRKKAEIKHTCATTLVYYRMMEEKKDKKSTIYASAGYRCPTSNTSQLLSFLPCFCTCYRSIPTWNEVLLKLSP